MNRFPGIVTLILLFLLMLSCSKPSPQLPSNKGKVIDENASGLLAMNQKLAIKEDSILEKFVLKTDKAFKRSEIGFWYKIDRSGNGSGIKDSVDCTFSCTSTLLSGKILETNQIQLVIGKKQTITGLEEGLKLLNKGDSATFIIPWYLAYGMNGKEPLIPPYTSLIYTVKVFN